MTNITFEGVQTGQAFEVTVYYGGASATGAVTAWGEVSPPVSISIDTGGGEDGSLPLDRSLYANRLHHIILDNAGEATAITSQPAHGKAHIQDGAIVYVPEEEGFTVGQISIGADVLRGGSVVSETVDLDLILPPGNHDEASLTGSQELGFLKWQFGKSLYQLRTDTNNRVMVEPGFVHRKIYCTPGGLTVAQIASLDDVSENSVTKTYLLNSDYGKTPAEALDIPNARLVWEGFTDNRGSSAWLLLERGYEYAGLGYIGNSGRVGESARYPRLLAPYGTGAKPIIKSEMRFITSGGIVVQDVDVEVGIGANFGSHNMIFDHVAVSGHEVALQGSNGMTLNHCSLTDAYRSEPKGATGPWNDRNDRISALFTNYCDGVLVEGGMMDHAGWGDGFSYDRDRSAPQPPSQFSHNYYSQYTTRDLTIVGHASTRAASVGIFARGGGHIVDCYTADNNLQFSNLSGNYIGKGWIGDYLVLLGMVATEAGYKLTDGQIGATSGGLWPRCIGAVIRDTILCHAANPDDAADIARVGIVRDTISHRSEQYINDAKIYDWAGSDPGKEGPGDRNLDGLDPTLLAQTTIQRFAQAELNDVNATADDLYDYMATLDEPAIVVRKILSYFRAAFGVADPDRNTAQTLTFFANDEGEGRRWDMRYNWTSSDLPGTVAGDSVQLAGHDVIFQRVTSQIVDLDTGNGSLTAYSGYLGVSGDVSGGGVLSTHNVGWIDLPGYDAAQALSVRVTQAGRMKFLGDVTGPVSATVADEGQLVLATGGSTFMLASGQMLDVCGGEVGFDGTGGVATLVLKTGSITRFTQHLGVLLPITTFSAGDRLSLPGVSSEVQIGGTLEVDLTNVSAGEHPLIIADTLIGQFDTVSITEGNGTVSYTAQQVILTVS